MQTMTGFWGAAWGCTESASLLSPVTQSEKSPNPFTKFSSGETVHNSTDSSHASVVCSQVFAFTHKGVVSPVRTPCSGSHAVGGQQLSLRKEFAVY